MPAKISTPPRGEADADLHVAIRRMARERNAIILAHNYERPEVQDVADVAGDSLGLSREAAVTDASVIVFCGVHFLPDMFLGAHVRRLTGRRNMHVWMGECHVHAGIDPENIRLQRSLHPDAEFLVHPECGCATSVVEAISAGDVDPDGARVLSTEGMIRRPADSAAAEFIVATEVGILYRLRRAYPDKTFYAANERASCAYMKVTTLPKVLTSLERLQHRITVPTAIAARARLAIERMIAIGGAAPAAGMPVAAGVDPGE